MGANLVFGLDEEAWDSHRKATEKGARFGRPVDLGRVLRSLYRRKWFLLAGAALYLATGAVVATTLVPVNYSAETVLVWEANEGNNSPNVRELRTLVDSVKLPTNLTLVRERLGMQTTLDRVAARLDVRFDRESNLVTVRADGRTPESAVLLSETAVDVFLEHQRAVARERLDEEVAQLESDAARANTSLREAQARYDAFRREHGVADLPFEQQQAIELAASLRAQADIARADAQAAAARSSTGVPVHRAGSAQLDDARRRLGVARVRLSEDHPRVQALEAEVAALRTTEGDGSASPVAGAGARVRADRISAEHRQRSYERMEQAARERLAQLSAVEGEASALLATVRVAEGHVADVDAELARAQDEARAASPGFRVVAPALLPEEPERSYRKPIAVGVPLVLLMALLIVMVALEMQGLRVKTASELAYWGRAPVAAATTWPSRSGELPPVISELAEEASLAGGRTLVVSASEHEGDAERIGEALRHAVAEEESIFHEPEIEIEDAWAAEPPIEQVIVTRPPTGAELSRADSEPIVERGTSLRKLDPTPGLAHREERMVTRRRGGRLERIRIATQRLVLDDERVPAEVISQSLDSGKAFVRRTSRAADRVLIVVRSGELSWARASQLRAMVGREDQGVAFLLIGVPEWLAPLADRAGPVESFWQTIHHD